jgi:hypothetical protein
MPTAPTYKRQVTEQPLRGGLIRTRVSPEDMGAGLGAAINRVANDYAEKEFEAADEIAVIAATNKLKQKSTEIMYDPKFGALSRRGRDAFDLPEIVMPVYDRIADEIASEMTTPRQKAAFARVQSAQRDNINLQVQRHVFQERTAYDKAETEGLVESSRGDAVHNYADPARVMQELQLQGATLMGYAKRNGLGPEQARKMVEQNRSKTLLDVIERAAAANNDKIAKVYFDEGKSFLVGDHQTKAAKLVEESSLRGDSQRVADQLLSDPDPDPFAIAEKIRDIKDPKLRDLVQNRVDAELQRREQRNQASREDQFMMSLNFIEQGGSFAALPASTVMQLTHNQRAALRSYQKSVVAGESIETDWALYYSLKTEATTEATMGAFAKKDLMQYRHKLGDTEFKEMVGLQAGYRKGDARDQDKINGYRTTKQIVDDSLASVGIDPTPKHGKTEAQQVAKFRRTVDEFVLQYSSQHGRPPPTKEVQQFVDNLLVKGKVPGSGIFWDSKKFAFELNPDERIAIKKADVPAHTVRKIEDALKRNNIPITDEKVIELYNLGVQGAIRAE